MLLAIISRSSRLFQRRTQPQTPRSKIAAGKTIFLHLGPSTEVSSSGGTTDMSIHRAWQTLGIIILNTSTRCYATTRRSNDPAKKKPASAPEASQKPPRAQERVNLKILTLKRTSSRPGDSTVASLTDGNMDTPHIIHIHGRHSPPPRLDPTPHVTKSTLQQPHGPAKIIRQKPKLLARLAR